MLWQQFSRFFVVGGLGFVVDAGALIGLMHLGGDAYLMRVISFTLAVSVTWWLNRTWTFEAPKSSRTRREYLSYVAVQLLGAAINYAVYALVLNAIGVTALNAFFALVCGSALALVWNFWAMRRFVFGAHGA